VRPLRVSGSSLSEDGRRFVGKVLSDSILTCHESYRLYPYSAVGIVSCSSLRNASRLAAFEELPGDCFVAIHGTTSSSNVASISDNGFRPSPAGCFGQGIYLAQNSSVALVHTCPKGQDFLAKGYLSKGKAFRSTGHFICNKMRRWTTPASFEFDHLFCEDAESRQRCVFPRPAMEMMYNGFPSTADRLSP